ncbi:MAG: YdeI/OmpD-associated family protein [Lewinellaceae bacterium]|nr:YdeI/OmpD-associated family protein [Lewinellaceae bacterium]
MKKPKSVDEFIDNQPQWKEALRLLRSILLSTGMEEAIKWGLPVYMVEGKNIAGLGAFQSHFGIWFFQGALLEDPHGKLVNAQEGKTKAMRQWRFQSIGEIDEKLVREYLAEAIRNQKQGREIKPPRKKPLVLPPELKAALDHQPELASRFAQLSHGKKREYAEYVSEAKRAETKAARLAKIIPMVLEGKGLNDKCQR